MDDLAVDLSRPRIGDVDRWVRVAVVVAFAATLGFALLGPRLMWPRELDPPPIPRWWFENTLALASAGIVAVALVVPARCTRYIRLAVVLPVVQIALLFGVWGSWQLICAQLPAAGELTPLLERLPISIVVPGLAGAIAVAGRLAARRRRREWLHAVLVIALVNLLLLGLWLPIAASTYRSAWQSIGTTFEAPARIVGLTLAPPLVAATLFTTSALRSPELWRRNHGVVATLLAVCFVIALASRQNVDAIGALVYINFTHVLGAAALIAVAALAALAAATWAGTRRARAALDGERALIGTVEGDGPVASLELASWLRGPRPACSGFVVTTAQGVLPVPAGVRVVCPTPAASTLLRRGEALATLRSGDRVALAGYVGARRDGPFRASSAPVPGSDGVVVGRVAAERYGFVHLAHDLWRPAVAYLVICTVIALPALAGLLGHRF